jgi:DNA-binding transcriptional regulator WhiA
MNFKIKYKNRLVKIVIQAKNQKLRKKIMNFFKYQNESLLKIEAEQKMTIEKLSINDD